MKKSIIALSVAAAMGGFASTAAAQANAPNPSGSDPAQLLFFNKENVGHLLYVPYFSTQEGNVTAISVVNTDSVRGKALKVRFRGASNSDDLYDFQVFLSPGDVWTARVEQGADGRSQLRTDDKSCTLPANINGSFILGRLAPAGGVNETREGYVEILNMGDIWQGNTTGTARNLYNATKHTKGVPTCAASVLTALTHENASTYLAVPTTGLFANWAIVNVQAGNYYAYSGDAAAIEAQATYGEPGYGNMVFWDQRSSALTPEQATANTSDPLIQEGLIAAARYDLPDLSTPYLPDPAFVNPNCPFCQAFALSEAIANYEVAGEFNSDASIGAQTDWVLSFPTRRYFAAVNYKETAEYDENEAVFNSRRNPWFRESQTEMGSAANGGQDWQLCTKFGFGAISFYDREETPVQSDDIVISPGTPSQLSICGEVAVIGINVGSSSATFGSVARTNVNNGFKDGWGFVRTPNKAGLPLLGTQFTRVSNTQTNQFYGLTFPLRILTEGEIPEDFDPEVPN